MGRKLLAEGGSAVDVCEKVIRAFEDDSQFNAGKGAVAGRWQAFARCGDHAVNRFIDVYLFKLAVAQGRRLPTGEGRDARKPCRMIFSGTIECA